METIEFPDGPDVTCETKREVKDTWHEILELNN